MCFHFNPLSNSFDYHDWLHSSYFSFIPILTHYPLTFSNQSILTKEFIIAFTFLHFKKFKPSLFMYSQLQRVPRNHNNKIWNSKLNTIRHYQWGILFFMRVGSSVLQTLQLFTRLFLEYGVVMERALKKIGPWTEEETYKVDPILTRTVWAQRSPCRSYYIFFHIFFCLL